MRSSTAVRLRRRLGAMSRLLVPFVVAFTAFASFGTLSSLLSSGRSLNPQARAALPAPLEPGSRRNHPPEDPKHRDLGCLS
jgi:hypothetical protein